MNQPNPDQLAKQGSSEYDNLSDQELLDLMNGAAKLKRGHSNFRPQVRPPQKNVVNLDQYLGGGE